MTSQPYEHSESDFAKILLPAASLLLQSHILAHGNSSFKAAEQEDPPSKILARKKAFLAPKAAYLVVLVGGD